MKSMPPDAVHSRESCQPAFDFLFAADSVQVHKNIKRQQ